MYPSYPPTPSDIPLPQSQSSTPLQHPSHLLELPPNPLTQYPSSTYIQSQPTYTSQQQASQISLSNQPEHPFYNETTTPVADKVSIQPQPTGSMPDQHMYKSGSVIARSFGRGFFIMSILVLLAALVFANLVLYSENIRLQLFNSTTLPWTPDPRRPVDGLNPSNNRRLLKLDATVKGAYFGASIDWDAGDTPRKFNKRLGKPAAVFQHFIDLSSSLERVAELKYIVESILEVDGALLALTVIPHKGLDVVTRQGIDQLARTVAFINKNGIPILLRYGHEMNGSWYVYGQKPQAYIESFRKVSLAIRQYTNQTYLVWAPNVPSGYPWPSSTSPRPGSADFKAMDTNNDGTLNGLDDPYTPFFPGSDYVDWIGFSIFYFGPNGSLTTNGLPSSTGVSEAIRFEAGPNVVWDIYTMFSKQFNKPFGLMETSAVYHPKNVKPGDPAELDIKRVWWRQLFSNQFHTQFPLLKFICWFDIKKTENVFGVDDLRDFRLSWAPSILNEFLRDLPSIIFFANTVDA